MVVYFNKKDLVSFGKYLLSEKRRESFERSFNEDLKNEVKNVVPLEDRLKEVGHWDYCNWIESIGKKE